MECVSYLVQVEVTVPVPPACDKIVSVALHCTVVYPQGLCCWRDCNQPRILVVLYCTQPLVEIDGPRALHLPDMMFLLVWSDQLILYILHKAKQRVKTLLPTAPSNCSLFKFYVCLLKTECKGFFYFCVWPVHTRYYTNIFLDSPSKTKKILY